MLAIDTKYLIHDKQGKIYIADTIRITDTTITVTNYCDQLNMYVSSVSMHSMPLDWVVDYTCMSDLICGNRFRFWKKDGHTFDANLKSYGNYHLHVNQTDENNPRMETTMPIFDIVKFKTVEL